ncbi:hypothetical protein M426DRAFT_216796 [Hypoxylon sp. CI-4A]|nr:hypothetical protein M426DRAFT_216796 [Hypoxylon sp. CI-4A]
MFVLLPASSCLALVVSVVVLARVFLRVHVPAVWESSWMSRIYPFFSSSAITGSRARGPKRWWLVSYYVPSFLFYSIACPRS